MPDDADSIRAAIASAVAELDALHYPNSVPIGDALYPGFSRPQARDGCVLCWPGDGSWPCVTRLVADDLRRLSEAK